jgi:hypothetical protein
MRDIIVLQPKHLSSYDYIPSAGRRSDVETHIQPAGQRPGAESR